MYNRYIPTGSGYTRVTEQDRQPAPPPPQGHRSSAQDHHGPDPSAPRRQQTPPSPQVLPKAEAAASPRQQEGRPSRPAAAADRPLRQHTQPPPSPFSLLSGKGNGLSALADMLRLDDLDSGDVLLILILLFLFRDGDDIELMITLGLILLLGLGDKDKHKDPDSQNT